MQESLDDYKYLDSHSSLENTFKALISKIKLRTILISIFYLLHIISLYTQSIQIFLVLSPFPKLTNQSGHSNKCKTATEPVQCA